MTWHHGAATTGVPAKSRLAELDGVLVAVPWGDSPYRSTDGGRTWAYVEAQDDTEYYIVGRQLAAKVGSVLVGAFNTGYGFRPCSTTDGLTWTVMSHTASSNNVYDVTAADWFTNYITFFDAVGAFTSRCNRSPDFSTWDSGVGTNHGWVDKHEATMQRGGGRMVHTANWQSPFTLGRPAYSNDDGENWSLSSYGSAIAAAPSGRPEGARYLWIEAVDRFLNPAQGIYSDDLNAWSSFTKPYTTPHCGFHWDQKAVVVAETAGEYALWQTTDATTWEKVSVLPETFTANVQYAYPVGEDRVVFVTSDASPLVLELVVPPSYFWTNLVGAYEVP